MFISREHFTRAGLQRPTTTRSDCSWGNILTTIDWEDRADTLTTKEFRLNGIFFRKARKSET